MLVASAIWGLYLVTSADMVGPAWFQPLYLMLRAVAPVALVHLALSFPVQRRILRRHPLAAAGALPVRGRGRLADNLAFDRSFTRCSASSASVHARGDDRRRRGADRAARARPVVSALGGGAPAHQDRRGRRRRRLPVARGRVLPLLRDGREHPVQPARHPARRLPGRHRLGDRQGRPVRGRRDHPPRRRPGRS